MLNEMNYVYAVYQEKSFSKAAKKLFISQPALSNMVKKAEKEIGMPIFDRSTIPLTVTKEGMYYINAIEEILFILRNVDNYFEDLKKLQTGHLSIGGSSFFCSYVFPDLISKFRNKYPNISIDLVEGNIKELSKGLIDETLDLIIETAVDPNDDRFANYFYKKEQIILAVPSEYTVNDKIAPYKLNYTDIAENRDKFKSALSVPLKYFADIPFVIMKPGNDIYTRSIAMCRNAGFEQKIAISVDQVITSVNIASKGLGALFIRSEIVKYLKDDGRLIYYKLNDPLAKRNISFSVKKNRYVTSSMREFMRMAGVKEI